ncbi:MAG: hypothetical protein ACKO6Q_05275 [Bacteroidota bacterium]
MNSLKHFLQEVNSIGFWGRIFGWGRIKRMLVDALSELQLLVDVRDKYYRELEVSRREHDQATILLQSTERKVNELERDKDVLESQLADLRERHREQDRDLIELRKTNDLRQSEHQQSLNAFSDLKNGLMEDRRREVELQRAQDLAKQERLRETWQRHQTDTKNKIRLLCERHTVQYVEKVPFRGEPDNTVLICNEYVVFDAKSPANDKHENFPNYLRLQAEAASKYADKEQVRSDIFFVVPSNVLEQLSHTVYEFAKHRVFVISLDTIEPVMLSLKKIEEYEFAEQMSPEDRENVCRAIGRFLHLIKRRLQVDNFFSKEALSLASDCESLLPADIIEEMIRMERAMILNPPQERSGKEISLGALQKESRLVEKSLEERGVITGSEEVGDRIKELPLYKESVD